MWKLVFCDIYRDGGSLGAVLSEGTTEVSLFLEILPWDRPPKIFQYKSLWVSQGPIPNSHGEEVPVASSIERHWLWQLENNVSTDTSGKDEQMRFRQLVAALRARNIDAVK
jgi:hypothetical protein